MENIKEDIKIDLAEAMKQRNEVALLTLRGVLASVLAKEKLKRYKTLKQEPSLEESDVAKKANLTKEEIIDVISFEVKKRREAVAGFEKGERMDLIKKEKAEIEVLQKYLPEQLSLEEIKKLVDDAIGKTRAKEMRDMGRVMGELAPKLKGKADNNEVSKMVKQALGSKD